eukprot:2491647-Rhodomonas_salina.1
MMMPAAKSTTMMVLVCKQTPGLLLPSFLPPLLSLSLPPFGTPSRALSLGSTLQPEVSTRGWVRVLRKQEQAHVRLVHRARSARVEAKTQHTKSHRPECREWDRLNSGALRGLTGSPRALALSAVSGQRSSLTAARVLPSG